MTSLLKIVKLQYQKIGNKMEIKINAKGEEGDIPITFDNHLNNLNFVNMVFGEEEYQVLLKELEAVVIAFNKISEV